MELNFSTQSVFEASSSFPTAHSSICVAGLPLLAPIPSPSYGPDAGATVPAGRPRRAGARVPGRSIAPQHPPPGGLPRVTTPVIPGGGREYRVISEDRVRALAGHRASTVVTSCYLDVDGRRHPRHADYETQLDHLMRQGRDRAAAYGPEAARSVAADLDRMAAWVRSGFDRSRVR